MYLALVVLVLGTGLGIGLGLSESPVHHATDSGQQKSTCVPDQVRVIWTSRALTVRKGMFVGFEVVEPAGYTNTSGFPWSSPTLSTSGVLTPARPCHSPLVATLPLAVYYFQATGIGSTTVTIPLSKSWVARRHSCVDVACAPLATLREAITVRGK
jgi:hypothetical protein